MTRKSLTLVEFFAIRPPPVCSRDGRRARGKSSENCCWRDHPCYARERTTRDGLVRLTPRRADRATSSSSALSLRGFARARVGPQDSRTDRRAGRRAGRGVARGGVPRAGRIRAGRRARSSMFFHLNLDKHVLLEPRHFGKNMREVLEEKLRNEVRARNREERRPSSLPGGSARVRQRDARGTRRGDRST